MIMHSIERKREAYIGWRIEKKHPKTNQLARDGRVAQSDYINNKKTENIIGCTGVGVT